MIGLRFLSIGGPGTFAPSPSWGAPPGTHSLAGNAPAAAPAALVGYLVPNLTEAEVGTRAPLYGGDLFDRFHYGALTFALGNLVGTQERTVVVWNTYYRSVRLDALSLANGEGITVSGLAAGQSHLPLSEVNYVLQVSTEGPPTINATLTWTYHGLAPVVATITGSRVTAWSWLPDWSSAVLDRLEWKTDVLTKSDGAEQRISVRYGARRNYEFTAAAQGQERQFLEAALWGWGARVWAVPLWQDTLYLAAPLALGATVVPADTVTREFQAGGLAMLRGATARDYEVVEVLSVTSSQVTLARPTTRAWPAGTRFAPARTGRLDDTTKLPRFTGEATNKTRFRFEFAEPWDGTPATLTQYRGYPVLEVRPDWDKALDLELQRNLAVLDAMTGPWTVEDTTDVPVARQSHGFTLATRAQVQAHKDRLALLRGRQGAIWVPTWTQDLTLTVAALSVDQGITVAWVGYTSFLQLDPGRRDLRIELRNGTVLYRRITGASEIDSNANERLTLDGALGVAIAPQDVLCISYMALARQAADAAELAYWTADVAEATTTWQSFRNDV